ncbi:MAG: hypothetical protein JO360_05405 [Acidobacteria bacterium]|nr:hypothetical protein [Acidobacteriota bacterium]
MALNKFFLCCCLLLVCAPYVAAQDGKCALKLAQLKPAHELYGMHLGMTLDQAKSLVPSLQQGQTDELGFSTTSFSPDFNPQINKAAYAGVRTVTLEFLDGKLFSLWIGYNSTFKWQTLEEFVPGMSEALGLPPGVWSPDSSRPTVECDDVELTAQMIGQSPSLRLVDRRARELWEQRRADKAEKRSEKEEPK